jgi:fructose-1,6-bisphosphatase
MIAEAAGGVATNGAERILEQTAAGVHDRTALAVGSVREVEMLQRMVREG